MEIELVEIRDFLLHRQPFETLPEEVMNELPKKLQIRYLRRGTEFPPTDADGRYLYVVRSGAIELFDQKQRLLGKLAEGDIYSMTCQLVDIGEEKARGHTTEDSLLYLLPCRTLMELRSDHDDFNRYFADSLRERMKRAVTSAHDSTASMTVEVSELLKKKAVTIDAGATIQQAAQVMSENSVSSVMVLENGQLAGIVTDRDLRKRCLAIGLSFEQPVRAIMSSNIERIQHDNLAIHAIMTMTRLHVHHLPVMRGDEVIGMLTASDVVRHQNTNSAFISADIRKAQSTDELIHSCHRLPELQLQLANSSATALHIGDAVSCITDALTGRLIEMAQAELGPAPVPFVWLAGGSQARREQTSHSDQDNALILSDDVKEADQPYFAELAKRVSDGLNACGFVYCPGDAMATNPEWRQPLRVWKGYFDKWINQPEPMALMLSSIFFDLRPAYGERALFEELQKEILSKSRGNGIFLAHMAANALQHRPPLGFFRTFVLIHDGEHDDTFDIKHRGIVPITDMARVFALAEGVPAVNTTNRLRAVAGTPTLSEEMAENLEDALEFIANLRIHHQADQIRKGTKADNFLPPDALSDLERKHLKDAFRVIQTMQESLESRYQTGRLR